MPTLTTRRVNSLINSTIHYKEISNGLENNKRITSYKGRKTTSSTIRHIFHRWTQHPRMDNKTLYLHRIELPMAIKEYEESTFKEYKDPEAPTAAEKKTLFYKLFSMSKREWDVVVKNQQKQLNKRQRDYFLTFKQHSKKGTK